VDAARRQRLIDDHVSMVRALAVKVGKGVRDHVDGEDLVAYGMQGLLEAALRFDDKHGVAFITFAYHRVKGAIYDGLRAMGHLPRSEYAKIRLQERANEYLGNLQDRETGAAAAGAAPAAASTEDDLRALYQAAKGVVTSFVTSLDSLVAEGHEYAEQGLDPEEKATLRQQLGRVQGAIAALPEKERHFIEMHYFKGKSLLEAGAALGLSKSWSSRLHARAIELLREKLEESAI
jgi:RNA polymerase sigma factor for flagellar operon FliA